MASTIILSDNGASSGSAGVKTTGGNDGVLILQTTTSGGTATNAVYIDTSQNVGIGTSSPNGPLDVNASVPRVVMSISGTAKGQMNIAGSAMNITANDATYPITFNTGGAERARIDSSGNVGVGTSSTANARLTVFEGSQPILKLATSASGTGSTDGFDLVAAGTTAYIYNRENGPMLFATNSAEAMRITSGSSVEYSTYGGGNLNTGEATIAWGNITSTTFDITTLFPDVGGLGSGVGLLIQIQTWTGSSSTGTSILVNGTRASSSWAFSTINNTNTGGGPTCSVSASGNVVTLTFSFGAQYGKARVRLLGTS